MRSVQAFKAAVLAALEGDSGLRALVGAKKVFDQTPQQTPFPYVYLGPVGAQRGPDDCGAPTWTLRMRLYATATTFGRDQAWNVIAAVDAALDGGMLAMPDGMGQVVAIQTIAGGDVVSPVAPVQTYLDLTATVAG